jgi:hypothetical protein
MLTTDRGTVLPDRYPQPYDDLLRELGRLRMLLIQQVELLEGILRMQAEIKQEIMRGPSA